MIKTLIKHAFIILIVALLQVAILPNLSEKLSNLDVILVTIIFVAVAYRFYIGVVYGFILGFYVALYSTMPFGSNLVLYMIVLYLVYLVSQKVLTNKSLYSLIALTLIGTVCYAVLFYIFKALLSFIDTRDYNLIKNYTMIATENIFWQVLLNLGCAFILFLVFHYGSRQFKAVFIDTTKN